MVILTYIFFCQKYIFAKMHFAHLFWVSGVEVFAEVFADVFVKVFVEVFTHLFWVSGVEVFPIVWPSSVFKLVPWNDTLSFCCFCVWFSKKVIPDDNMFYVLPPHHPQLKNVNLKAEATLAKGCLATSKAGRGDAACSSHCRRPARSQTCRGL